MILKFIKDNPSIIDIIKIIRRDHQLAERDNSFQCATKGILQEMPAKRTVNAEIKMSFNKTAVSHHVIMWDGSPAKKLCGRGLIMGSMLFIRKEVKGVC